MPNEPNPQPQSNPNAAGAQNTRNAGMPDSHAGTPTPEQARAEQIAQQIKSSFLPKDDDFSQGGQSAAGVAGLSIGNFTVPPGVVALLTSLEHQALVAVIQYILAHNANLNTGA